MKIEIMALRKVGDLAQALDLLSAEGAYEVHTVREGEPLAGKREAPTLVIDRLESIVAPNLDVIRLAVNAIEVAGVRASRLHRWPRQARQLLEAGAAEN